MLAKKHLGQHFLCNSIFLGKIAAIANQLSAQTVVEIGPGRGHLTEFLLPVVKQLICIEKDKDLLPLLREKFQGFANLQLIQADALKFDFDSLQKDKVLVANLPYNVSVPLIMEFMRKKVFESQAVLVQKEVAQRFASQHNSKSYGRVSVLAQTYTQVRKHFDVPGHVFRPKTKVMSSFISLTQKECNIDFASFSQMLEECFKHRRFSRYVQ